MLYRYIFLEFLLFSPLEEKEKLFRCFPFYSEKDTDFPVPHDSFSSFLTFCVNFGKWSGMRESSERLKILDFAFFLSVSIMYCLLCV